MSSEIESASEGPGARRRRITVGMIALCAALLVSGVAAGGALSKATTHRHHPRSTRTHHPKASVGHRGTASAKHATASPGHRLVSGMLAGLSLANLLGAAPAGQQMTIGVAVQRPHPAAEAALYSELYDPASKLYHHFLTPAAFDRRFGVSAASTRAVSRWLTAGGLSVLSTSPGGDYLLARGTVAQLQQRFGIKVGSYAFKSLRFLANDTPPSVPNALPIGAVTGLDTLSRFSVAPLTHDGTIAAALQKATKALGSPAVAAGTQGVFTPQDLWGIYDDPGASALTNANGTSTPATLESTRTDVGQGQTMGIFGEGESSSVIDQLRLFEQSMGLPKVPVQVDETEGGPQSDYGDNSGSTEWYLDSQASTGMAPDVSKLDLYFAKTLYDPDIFADINAWANDPSGPRQMNASFGECEANPTNPVTGPLAQLPYGTELGDELEAVGDPILRQAAIEGRTLFSSAGDTGSGCPEVIAPVVGAGNGTLIQPVPFVSYPCASPYAVCVGGTVIGANGTDYPQAAQRASETSWTFGGGGTSYFIPAPSFQSKVANVDHRCLTTPSGTPYPVGSEPTCRGVPDVSDLSGNVTGDGYFIYADGEPSSEGGTSLSSPLMMGQWTRVQAAASTPTQARGGLGFADPTIYRQAAGADACTATDTAPCTNATYTRDFTDITQSEYGIGNGADRPAPGWDYASGWGALDVANFTDDVDGTTNAASAVGAPAPAATATATASMTSPQGNAADPVLATAGNVSSLDLTGATLTASASKGITATLTGPGLGARPPLDATEGESFFVTWSSGGEVYYARADESLLGTYTYTSGNTGTYGQANTYAYNDTSASKATGSAANGTITIHVPASEVGSPRAGSQLSVPQAFDQMDAVTGDATTDSSDDIGTPLSDHGAPESTGVAVTVAP